MRSPAYRFLMALTVLLTAVPVLAGGALFPALAATPKSQAWLETARTMADRDGYRLMDLTGLGDLLADGERFILLDVRPDYEFKAGHLPGAVNLEFHLGDRSRLTPAKQAALDKILGSDKAVKVVVYCRSKS